jgi:hypothetical protein
MGEHGNVSNASAGFVGSNMASGIESNRKNTKRDTVPILSDVPVRI